MSPEILEPRGGPSGGARLRDWFPELLLLGVTTLAGLAAGGRWLDPSSDPGIWLSLPVRLAEGERYYRDLPLQFGPVSPYLLALGVEIFGFSATFALLANWIPAVVAGILLLRAGRPHLSTLERVALSLLILALGPFAPGRGRLVYSYAPPAVHALVFSLGALLLFQRRGAPAKVGLGAGLLSGLSFCSKQEIGAAALASLLLTEIVCGAARRRRLPALVGGFLLAVIPAAILALSSASLESLRLDSHLWPLSAVPDAWVTLYRHVAGISAAGWPSRVLESVRGLLLDASLLALAGVLLARDWAPRRWLPAAGIACAVTAWNASEGTSFSAGWSPARLSMVVAFVVALVGVLDRRRPGRGPLIAFGAFSGLVAARTAFSDELGGPYSGVSHLATALTWCLLLFSLLPAALPGGDRATRMTRRLWGIAVLVAAGAGAFAGFRSLADSSRVAVETARGRFWAAPRLARFYGALSRDLRAGERALVLPETNAVDVLYGVRLVSPYLVHLPGSLDRRAEERLLERLAARPPDVVVVFRRETEEYGVAPLGIGFGRELMGWIRRHYRTVLLEPGGEILRPASDPTDVPPL